MNSNAPPSGSFRGAALFLLCIAALGIPSGCGKRELPAPGNFTVVELKPGDGDLAALLQAESRKAGKLGRKPFVQFYADWCGPCRDLRASLDDPLMKDAFDNTYLIWLNVDDWRDRLAGTGLSVRVIPVFYELNADGRQTGRKIDGNAWGDNVPACMAPPLKEFFRGTL